MSYFGVELNLTQTVLPRIGPHSCDNTPQINISGCRAINLANSNMDSLFPSPLQQRHVHLHARLIDCPFRWNVWISFDSTVLDFDIRLHKKKKKI